MVFRCGVLWPGGVDLPIVGTSLYLGLGFIKSGSSQTCQTSVPRNPPPLGADARQLLHVAYKGWVTSVQFIFIVNQESFCAIELNIEDALYPEPGLAPGVRARTSSQDFEPGLRARTRARTGRRTRQFFAFPPFSRPANPMRVRVEFELGLS